jgi:hypothetical protein
MHGVACFCNKHSWNRKCNTLFLRCYIIIDTSLALPARRKGETTGPCSFHFGPGHILVHQVCFYQFFGVTFFGNFM